jgi:hypothetical protein
MLPQIGLFRQRICAQVQTGTHLRYLCYEGRAVTRAFMSVNQPAKLGRLAYSLWEGS